MAQYNSNIRNRVPGLSKMFAGLVLTASTLATISPVWGQYTGESRWSVANPPTPTLVDQGNVPRDDQLRRLPPIDQVSPPNYSPAPSPEVGPRQPGGNAPESPLDVAAKAANAQPVDWSNPRVTIGPDSRVVSHEEALSTPQNRPSRYSSAPAAQPQSPTSQGGSRFTQTAPVAPVTQDDGSSAGKPKSGNSVFARVFDENEETVEQASMQEPIAQPQVAQKPVTEGPTDEVAAVDSGLSPIFACRLLGLPATNGEEEAEPATQW